IEVGCKLPLNAQIPLLGIGKPITIERPINGNVIVKGLTIIEGWIQERWFRIICRQPLAQEDRRGQSPQRIAEALGEVESGAANATLPARRNSSIVEDAIACTNHRLRADGVGNPDSGGITL